MKKTDKTAFTAALFAAAMSAAAAGGQAEAAVSGDIDLGLEKFSALYAPLYVVGDVNADNSVDTFDMVKLRSIVTGDITLKNRDQEYRADVNMDGTVNVADLVAMSRFLIGQTNSLTSKRIKENAITVIDEATATEPSTASFNELPQPEYGPPYSEDTDLPVEPFDPDDPPMQAYYGPPSFFGLEDF